MQPSFSNNSNSIGQDSSYFLCTCGAEFERLYHYQKHLRVKHQPRTIIPPDHHTNRQESLSIIITKNQQSISLNSEVKIFEDSIYHSIKSPNSQIRCKQERRRAINTLSKGRSSKKSSNFDEETTTWQGFKLIKNKYCHIGPYYCGNCDAIYLQIKDYITHCIQDCQTLIHQESSHTITLDLKQEATSDDPQDIDDRNNNLQQQSKPYDGISPLYVLQTYPQLKEPKTQRIQDANLINMKKKTLPYKQVIQQSHIKQLVSSQNIYDILIKLKDHRSIPFSCGNCSITIKNPHTYKRHINRHRNEQLNALGSHVILQLQNGNDKHNLYMCLSVKWHHDQMIYFCPCSIDSKVSMSSLLQHVMTEHHGISPVYFQQTRINRNKIKKNQDYAIRDSMYYLRTFAIDHKNVPFHCYPCNLHIKNGHQYKDHMRDAHNNSIHPNSSHIIFLFKKNRIEERKRVYVCPHIKWAVAEHSDYYCSCEPERKITMETLIQHIIRSHHGITPEYSLSDCLINKKISQDLIKHKHTRI